MAGWGSGSSESKEEELTSDVLLIDALREGKSESVETELAPKDVDECDEPIERTERKSGMLCESVVATSEDALEKS